METFKQDRSVISPLNYIPLIYFLALYTIIVFSWGRYFGLKDMNKFLKRIFGDEDFK